MRQHCTVPRFGLYEKADAGTFARKSEGAHAKNRLVGDAYPDGTLAPVRPDVPSGGSNRKG